MRNILLILIILLQAQISMAAKEERVDISKYSWEELGELLTKKAGLRGGFRRGFTNYWIGSALPLTFMVQPGDSNYLIPYTIFYDKEFKYYTKNFNDYYAVADGGKICGVRLKWAMDGKGTPLKGKTGYAFWAQGLTLDKNHPSYILVDGVKVWEYGKTPFMDGPPKYKSALGFFYLEKAGNPLVDIVLDRNMHPDVDKMDIRKCYIKSFGNYRVKDKNTSYEKINSPAGRCKQWEAGLVKLKGDIKLVAYASKGTETVISIGELKKIWKPYKKPSYRLDKELILARNVSGYDLNKEHDGFLIEYCGLNSVGAGKFKEKEQEFIDKYKDRIDYIIEKGGHKISTTSDRINKILERYPGKKVVLAVEVWGGYNKATFRQKGEVKDPERVITVIDQWPAGLNNGYLLSWHKEEINRVIQKNTEGPQINIMIANVRGIAKVSGGRHGNCWCEAQLPPVTPKFQEQVIMLYYFSGGDLVSFSQFASSIDPYMYSFAKSMRLMALHPERGRQVVKIGVLRGDENTVGPYNRFANMDIGQLNYSYESKTGKMDIQHSQLDEDSEAWDYNLLDVFFAKYGTIKVAHRTRVITGTPYGPLDLLHTDIKEETMKDYNLLVFLGEGRVSGSIEEKLKRYIENGGRAVVSIGHLTEKTRKGIMGIKLNDSRKVSDKVVGLKSFFEKEIAAGNIEEKEVVEYVDASVKKVCVTKKDKIPVIIEKSIGKGKFYLVLTNRPKDAEAGVRNLLSYLGEKVKMLEFLPFDDQMEYTVMKKGETAIFALFNHRTIPIGTTDIAEVRADFGEPMLSEVKGDWKGEIKVNLENVGLDANKDYEVYEILGVDYNKHPDVLINSEEYKTKMVKSKKKGKEVIFNLTIGRRGEFIIGPKGKAKKDFIK